MDIEKLEKIADKFTGKLMKVQRSLDTIALLMLVDEFYTKDERKQLYDEYTRYCDGADLLRTELRGVGDGSVVRESHKGDDRSLLRDKLTEAHKLVIGFQKEHGLITMLVSRNKLYSDRNLDD